MQDLCHDTYFKLCRHEMLYLMDILLVIIWEKVRLELVVVCWAVVVETGLCCIVTQVNVGRHRALDCQLDEFDWFHMQH